MVSCVPRFPLVGHLEGCQAAWAKAKNSFEMPDPKVVYDEIAAAFRDSHPAPSRCYPEDFEPYDEEADRFDYLVGKTWLDVAGDEQYLAGHIEEEFFFMTKECFLYFLPGYLLGIITHNFASTRGVAPSLLRILGGSEDWTSERLSYLMEKLTARQKTAVAHWLNLQRERGRAGELSRHIAYYCEAALPKWQEWGAPPPDDSIWSQYPPSRR
jgi:hypothetical protein